MSGKRAFLFIDIEVSGSGRFKTNLSGTEHRILSLGATVIEADSLETLGDDLVIKDQVTLDQIIPAENRFMASVHDAEALDSIQAWLDNPAPETEKPHPKHWDEIKGREFWLAPKNRPMLLKALEGMRASNLDPTAFILAFLKWFKAMEAKYKEDLTVISDTSNFDLPWIDYYLNWAGETTINWQTRHGFVCPIDSTSYYAGLLGLHLSLDAWDNFNSDRQLSEAGYKLVDTSAIIDPHSHNPLDDAIRMGLKFVAVQASPGPVSTVYLTVINFAESSEEMDKFYAELRGLIGAPADLLIMGKRLVHYPIDYPVDWAEVEALFKIYCSEYEYYVNQDRYIR